MKTKGKRFFMDEDIIVGVPLHFGAGACPCHRAVQVASMMVVHEPTEMTLRIHIPFLQIPVIRGRSVLILV